jgi:hypothetical protein
MQDRLNDKDDATLVPLADGKMEALRLVKAMQQKGLTIRLLGGLAVSLRCPSAGHRALNRVYADLDFVAYKRQARALEKALQEQGYRADRRFNALHGEQRLLFFDDAHERQVDIFLGVFEMCHKLPLERRLELHPFTLDPADLLLTKLQIVQLNTKDLRDMLALLLDFEPKASTAQPGEELDMTIMTRLCAQDWGWYTTVQDNLERVAQEAQTVLVREEAQLIRERVQTLQQHMRQAPKSVSWKMRDKLGRRVQWYDLPEEVRR